MNYYYADSANQPVGPLPLEQLHALAQAGTIGLDTHVLAEGSEEWQQYRSLLPTLPPPTKSLIPIGRYAPIIEVAPVVPPAKAVTKECPFCAEPVAAAAKKCKHCGEILDVTLRAAEEAKRARAHQPMVFMNAGGAASSASSSSTVVVVSGKKKSSGCVGCLVLAILAFILFSIISANVNKTPFPAPPSSPRPTPVSPTPKITRP